MITGSSKAVGGAGASSGAGAGAGAGAETNSFGSTTLDGYGSTDLRLYTSTKLKIVNYWFYSLKHKKQNVYLNII